MRRWGRMTMLLAAALLLVGCKETEEVPKLIAPVAEVGYFLPAQLGKIGDVYVLEGQVRPMEYGQYYKTGSFVSEILVEIGDVVEEGQILAVADVEAAGEYLSTLEENLAYEKAAWELQKEIAWLQIHMMELSGQATGVMWENMDYDEKLHDYRAEKLEESIEEYTELVENGTLYADHAGRVTYVKDLGTQIAVAAHENVVVIADETEKCITSSTTLDEFHYEDYKEQFIFCQGEKVKVEQLPYTSEEEILCQASDSYPYVRFSCPDGYEFEVGENCPLFFLRKDYEESVLVGEEALVRAEGRYYVYVQTENGKERREVTLGERDAHYAQITEGLEAGEMVYYESALLPPAEYEEITVSRSDFSLLNHSDTWEYGYEKTDVYTVPYDGMVMELMVQKGDVVEEGQVLYTLQTDIRQAALKDAQSAIEKENQSYEDSYKSYGKQLSDAKNIPGDMGSTMRWLLSDQRKLLTLRHEHVLSGLEKKSEELSENNDGEGLISVCAREAGTVQLLDVRPGQTKEIEVKAGLPLVVTTAGEPDKLLFWLKESDNLVVYPHFTARLWNDVTVEGKDLLSPSEKGGMSAEEIKEAEAIRLCTTGECVGVAIGEKEAEVPYVRTDGETPVLTYSLAEDRQLEGFAVDLGEDIDRTDMPGHLEASFTCFALKNVIVIPESAVCKEKDIAGRATGNYYVWVKQDGRLVQRFVKVDMEHVNYKEVAVLYGLTDGEIIAD